MHNPCGKCISTSATSTTVGMNILINQQNSSLRQEKQMKQIISTGRLMLSKGRDGMEIKYKIIDKKKKIKMV
jgi:hypothetical protein